MALHIRSLKLKPYTSPHVLCRCFGTQVQSSKTGDKRPINDVDWESFANELSSACEEARKRVSLLPSLPASSRLAVLLSESQKLVEAVNKHVAIASLYQTVSPREELNLTNQKGHSWSKVKGQALSVKSGEAIEKTLETEQKLTESLEGFGLFVQPYSYTTDDIIIRGDHMLENVALFNETLHADRGLQEKSRAQASSDKLSQQFFLLQHDLTLRNHNHEQSQHALLYCGLPQSSEKLEPQSKSPSPRKGGPSNEQLGQFRDHITRAMPRFFVERHNYHVYHKDIVFENNYWGTNLTANGLNAYALQLSKLRFLASLKFAHMEVVILKCTIHPEDGTVRMRWRLKGLSQFKALMFWKFLPWNYKKGVRDESQWYDGFSVYHLNSEGLVVKHRVDQVMPDEELQTVKTANLAVKLGLLMGLAPKPGLNDFASLFYRKSPPPNSALPGQH
ncbi:uncharacterized protein LOC135481018 [Liolophura sinensis]|uniref:uncharacterized protein LOC135481018 n=1 Tax=Liolophura sinensis TaxID=3198878 RepID=UPI003158E468